MSAGSVAVQLGRARRAQELAYRRAAHVALAPFTRGSEVLYRPDSPDALKYWGIVLEESTKSTPLISLRLEYPERGEGDYAGTTMQVGLVALCEGRLELVRVGGPRNPPAWARDPKIWRKAKRHVIGPVKAPLPRHYRRYRDPWALIAHWYREYGGRVA